MDERIYGLLGRKLGHSWSVPIHAALDIARFNARPVILDKGIRLEYIGTDLAAPFDRLLLAFDVFGHLFAFLQLEFIQLGTEKTKTLFLILELGAFILAGSDDPRRNMSHSDSRARLIDMLSAGAAASVGIYSVFFIIDLHIKDFFDIRHS